MNKLLLYGLLFALVLSPALSTGVDVSCAEFKLGNVYGSYVSGDYVYHNVNGTIYGTSTLHSSNYYTGYNYYVQGKSILG